MGLEITAAVAAQDFQLSIDGFDRVSGGKGPADRVRVGDEGQVVRPLLAHFGDEAGIAFGETIAELFELLLRHFHVPGSLDDAPALLKLGSIGFREMGFGVALQVHGTELNIAAREQALGDGQQSGEIILHQDEHAA